MNKRILPLLITAFLLACNFLIPQASSSTPEPITPPPTQDTLQPSEPPAAAATGSTIVRLHPGDGDLPAMLVTEAQKAGELGQIPIVEFDATWCPPCKAIEKWLEAENEAMLKAYSGTYIIKLDVDEWGWNDGGVEDFRFDAIPVYFKLDPKGKQTGEVIDGGAWNEDIPENIAPVMDEFFHGE
jgi:thiol-disulfide isomerase/thioredoxin